jgi:DNA fragmentation factor alpha subunit
VIKTLQFLNLPTLNLTQDKFAIEEWMEVYLVLEEDGTEVDDEEYFQTIEGNIMLMLLLKDDIWSLEGPPYA